MRWLLDRKVYHAGLTLLLFVGLACIIVPLRVSWNDYGILEELGKAPIIAFVLGITIEPWMRKGLARDVFSAAFGYSMPDDFKEEIIRISSQRTICTKHIMESVFSVAARRRTTSRERSGRERAAPVR
jgi:hypothetical protein